jgi:hypothetical protein
VALGKAVLLTVSDLGLGKQAPAYLRGALQGELHPLDVDDINPDSWYDETFHGAYVTADSAPAKGL